MGQFLQVNGDYNIKSAEGGKITFDTGPASSGGQVLITGNLVIEGTQTTVEATNLDVNDNIITLNAGETGSGVTLTYSGIEIDRGTASPASLLYDEFTNSWLIANSSAPGPFNFDESNLRLRRILTDSSTDDGALTLIGTGTGVVNVIGTDNYEDQVTAFGDDAIPNKKYVDDSILNNPTFQISAPQGQDTKVIIADKEIDTIDPDGPGSMAFFNADTTYTTNGESAVSIIVDSSLIAQFYSNRLEVGDIEIGGGIDRNEISSRAGITNENIIIRTQGTGKVQINYALQLERIGTSGETPPLAYPNTPITPAYVSGSTLLYAATPDIGNTGLWFINDKLNENSRAGTGELISKNKALVFSMLF
jgi:hypothetical protein